MPNFTLNDATTQQLSPAERHLINQPFDSSLADFEMILRRGFAKPLRQASRVSVSALTISVVRAAPESVARFPCIMAQPSPADPSNWGFMFRYRADVPWYICCFAGHFEELLYAGQPIMQLMHTRDLTQWPQLDYFIAEGLWNLQQNKGESWCPLENFLSFLGGYVRSNLIADLDRCLRNTNFFPVESSETLQWKLEQDNSDNAWEEIQSIARSFCQPLTDPDLQGYWKNVRNNPRTQVWVARSLLYPEPDQEEGKPGNPSGNPCNKKSIKKRPEPTMLGFLVGGPHPLNGEPQIHGACVLPDERRRGIATSLIKRFFAQTGYAGAGAGVYMGPQVYQYEAAALIKKLSGEVRVKGKYVWHFHLPSTAFACTTPVSE